MMQKWRAWIEKWEGCRNWLRWGLLAIPRLGSGPKLGVKMLGIALTILRAEQPGWSFTCARGWKKCILPDHPVSFARLRFFLSGTDYYPPLRPNCKTRKIFSRILEISKKVSRFPQKSPKYHRITGKLRKILTFQTKNQQNFSCTAKSG